MEQILKALQNEINAYNTQIKLSENKLKELQVLINKDKAVIIGLEHAIKLIKADMEKNK